MYLFTLLIELKYIYFFLMLKDLSYARINTQTHNYAEHSI